MEVEVPGFGPVREAEGFWARWRGLRGSSRDSAILLRGSSVHGFGMDRPLTAVALDRHLTVIRCTHLEPNRVVWVRGARWIIELPEAVTPPAVGTRLTAHG